jgi:hypothetical protein
MLNETRPCAFDPYRTTNRAQILTRKARRNYVNLGKLREVSDVAMYRQPEARLENSHSRVVDFAQERSLVPSQVKPVFDAADPGEKSRYPEGLTQCGTFIV